MKHRFLLFTIIISFLFVSAICLGEQTSSLTYHSPSEIFNTLKKLNSEYSQLSKMMTIGKTGQGNDIPLLEISNQKNKPNEKQAILVVGNIEGNQLIGSEIILHYAQNLLGNYSKYDSVTALLDKYTFYLLPVLNIDATRYSVGKVIHEITTNLTPTDDDFDALVDEDGPEDLNGDGLITMMRIRDPQGKWMKDTSDARIMRLADPLKGEKGQYRLETEGIDNDNDEKINEDCVGGVALNKNFPQAYPHFQPNSGKYMLSEPESRALVEFMNNHKNIVAVVVYGEYDNLISPPELPKPAPSEKKEPDKRKIMAAEDIFIYQKVSEIYREITKYGSDVPKIEPGGAFHQWCYFQSGVPAFCARVWSVPEPDAEKSESAEKDSLKIENQDSLSNTAKEIKNKSEKSTESEDAKWLAWSDAKLEGKGFVDWQPFKHPSLGEVEIGGFRPFLQSNPPASQISDIVTIQIRFLARIAELLPSVEIDKIEVKEKSRSVYSLEINLEKKGFLPDATKFAHDYRLVKPTVVKIDVGKNTILSGKKIIRLSGLRLDGDTEKIEWQIFANKGTEVSVDVLTEKAGQIHRKIKLQ